jgi:hypothetical protein
MPLLSINDHFANIISLSLTARNSAPRINVGDPLPIASRDVYSDNRLQCNFFPEKNRSASIVFKHPMASGQ